MWHFSASPILEASLHKRAPSHGGVASQHASSHFAASRLRIS
jgi:hypothetical protein